MLERSNEINYSNIAMGKTTSKKDNQYTEEALQKKTIAERAEGYIQDEESRIDCTHLR